MPLGIIMNRLLSQSDMLCVLTYETQDPLGGLADKRNIRVDWTCIRDSRATSLFEYALLDIITLHRIVFSPHFPLVSARISMFHSCPIASIREHRGKVYHLSSILQGAFLPSLALF